LVSPASAAILDVWINVQQVTGGPFDITIEAMVTPELAGDYGLQALGVDITTSANVMDAEPLQGWIVPGVIPSGNVDTVFNVPAAFGFQQAAPWADADGDTDKDAVGFAVGMVSPTDVLYAYGTVAPIATEKWECYNTVPTLIDTIVSGASGYWYFDGAAITATLFDPAKINVHVSGDANVPEPSTMALVVIGGLTALARRRRS
jgi:hypothetical protein